jgi:hypothetical protein
MLPSGGEADVEAFHRHAAVTLAELRDGEEFLSLAWIRRLLEAFLQCQEEFRVVVAQARRQRRGAGGVPRARREGARRLQRRPRRRRPGAALGLGDGVAPAMETRD